MRPPLINQKQALPPTIRSLFRLCEYIPHRFASRLRTAARLCETVLSSANTFFPGSSPGKVN